MRKATSSVAAMLIMEETFAAAEAYFHIAEFRRSLI